MRNTSRGYWLKVTLDAMCGEADTCMLKSGIQGSASIATKSRQCPGSAETGREHAIKRVGLPSARHDLSADSGWSVKGTNYLTTYRIGRLGAWISYDGEVRMDVGLTD